MHNVTQLQKQRNVTLSDVCVCVNAIRTILQCTLVTHGHLFRVGLGATKGTYIPIITDNILSIIVLLWRCGPYMCRYVVPQTIWRVPYLAFESKIAANAKVHAYAWPFSGNKTTKRGLKLPDPNSTGHATSVACKSLAPTRGAMQQSVHCGSLTPARGATQQSVDSEIVPVSSIAPEGPKEVGNASSPLHSQGSPTKGGQNQKSKALLGVTMMPLGAPRVSKYGSLVRLDAQIVAVRAHCA